MKVRWLLCVSWVLVGGCASLRSYVQARITPDVPFAQEPSPPPPDYALPESWSALPERQDAGDALPVGVPGIDQRAAPVDVFYVHPTSYVGSRWNAPTDDPKLNEATDRVATGIQAPAFNGCCAIYAPRYRQANGSAFYAPNPDGELAIDLAYDDVKRAFSAFHARRGPGRPFVLAGHSQGSVLGERLLYEEISGTPLRDLLVVAVLPGGSVTADGLREHAPDLPPCASRDDVGCVVAWNARGPGYEPGDFELRRPDTRPKLCTNPLSWGTQGAVAADNLGAVFLEDEDQAPRPAFADARCEGGTLVVSSLERAPRDLPSRVLDAMMGRGNYHPIEYQIFFMNLRSNVQERVAAFPSR
jgi:hypothetical protein